VIQSKFGQLYIWYYARDCRFDLKFADLRHAY
jgi:hypothetical protein